MEYALAHTPTTLIHIHHILSHHIISHRVVVVTLVCSRVTQSSCHHSTSTSTASRLHRHLGLLSASQHPIVAHLWFGGREAEMGGMKKG